MTPDVRILAVPRRGHRLDDELERREHRLVDSLEPCQGGVVSDRVRQEQTDQPDEVIPDETVSPGKLYIRHRLRKLDHGSLISLYSRRLKKRSRRRRRRQAACFPRLGGEPSL